MPRPDLTASGTLNLFIEPTPPEREAFQDHAEALMGRYWSWIFGFCLGALWIWRPLDVFVFAGAPIVQNAHMVLAIQLTIGLGVFWVFGLLSPQYRPSLRVLAVVAGAVGTALISWGLGGLQDMDGPWFYFMFFLPFFNVLAAVEPRTRAAVVAAAVILISSIFIARNPAMLEHRHTATALSFLVFDAAFAWVLGHGAFVATRAAFVQQRRLGEAQEALETLNGRLADEVLDRTRDLRALAVHIEGLREEERRWMAAEIHDGLGQEITALRFGLALAQKQLAREPGVATDALDDVGQQLERTHVTLRRILGRLRPRVLDEVGLVAALAWLAADVEAQAAVPCTTALPPDELELDPGWAIALFRVAQEALNNAVQHARATQLSLSLADEPDSVVLDVRDDGVGVEGAPLSSANSMGVIGIEERVRALGGAVSWKTPSNGGLQLTVRVPKRPAGAP